MSITVVRGDVAATISLGRGNVAVWEDVDATSGLGRGVTTAGHGWGATATGHAAATERLTHTLRIVLVHLMVHIFGYVFHQMTK
jgi:hypothetical protein